MGSDFVTVDQAATLLGRTKQTIYDYCKSGVLRKVMKDGHRLIPLEDVEELRLELGSGFPPLNRKTFFRLVAQVQQLQMDIAVLKKMNGINDSPLRPSKEEAGALYAHTQLALKAGTWSQGEVETWAQLFFRMDDVFFDVMAPLVEDREPWRPFYTLCKKMLRHLSELPDFSTNLRLQHLNSQLLEGMKTIRKVVLVWLELGNGKGVDLEAEDTVARRLAAKAAPHRG